MNGFPTDILMVSPEYFDVMYQINPYMADEKGRLKIVDKSNAVKQWKVLFSHFEKLGLRVTVLSGVEGLPDMVFAANQSFPFLYRGEPALLMSKMFSAHRQGEVSYFEKWAAENSIELFHLKHPGPFEGTGDMIWDSHNKIVFGGHGFRTEQVVYDEIEQIIDRKVYQLELVSPYFYHLDTCFAVLNRETALFVKEAFSHDGVELIRSLYKEAIEIPMELATKYFTGNCFCPDGKNILMHPSDSSFCAKLIGKGFNIIEVDTSEFMKSGGSVFCLKLALHQAC